MSIGTRIRDLRWDARLKQGALARRAGIAQNTLSQIELGKTTPSVPTLEKIARGLNIELPDLLEEPVPLGEALEAESWEKTLAIIRERQSAVDAKVEELLELPRSEVDPYEVKWALDEAKDCALTLTQAIPGSYREQDKITIEFDFRDPRRDLGQWEEFQNAWRFYDGIVERLVEAGLAELRERAGQRAEPVPVGIGA
jgi:transcriptional regulator with XRE-family HTH domain